MRSRALALGAPLLLAFAMATACNADPREIGKKPKVVHKKDWLPELASRWATGRVKLFPREAAGQTRLVLRPADIPLLSPKRQEAGVLVQVGDQARDTLRLLEWATSRSSIDCPSDWVLHVLEEGRDRLVEFQWECKTMRLDGRTYDLQPTAQKLLGNLITTARLHPTHKATVVLVPVVHDPEYVSQLVSTFVQEVLPGDVGLLRYPSFTVTTEHYEALTRDLTQLDAQVAALRERLTSRLNEFAKAIRARGGDSIVRILDPAPIKENFSREMHARWGMTVLCALGTGSERMYYLASSNRFGIVRMEVPTHYPMLVVQLPVTDPRPGLGAQLEAMHLDPPLLWPK